MCGGGPERCWAHGRTYPTRPTVLLVKNSKFFSVFLTVNFPSAVSGEGGQLLHERKVV